MTPEIAFSLLAKTDFCETVDMLTETFCRNDPIEVAMQVTHDEFRAMIKPELEAVIDNGLSVVARDRDSGRLVGALLAADILAETVDSRGKVSQKFDPISEIARDFHHFYLNTHALQVGHCLYLFVLGIHTDFFGLGFGKMLTREALTNARSKGYQSALSLTTNSVSTHLLKNFMFEPIKTQEYQTYKFRGQAVFSSITDHPGVNLMELDSLREFE